ncbi:MAG: hypothetical protein H6648_03595 [Caldilineae bacterium]|nr:hypothetical protein [Chloroflexota bacterium]MCB9176219.1 hypothetical protein [Caldilineae bacterium]
MANPESTYLLELDGIHATDPARAGAKAAALARMLRAGCRVPGGFVVSTDAFHLHLDSDPEMRAAITALRSAWTGDAAARRRTAELAETLRGRVVAQRLPEPLMEALDRRLPALLREGAVAVRASASLEDRAGESIEGLYASFLNLSGRDAVHAALTACWAALWSPRALAYRRRRGIAEGDVSMAVLIQRLVPGDISGTATLRDLAAGRDETLQIDAGWGLGWREPDPAFEMDRIQADPSSGQVLSYRTACKPRAWVAGDRGLVRQTLSPERAGEPCLDATRVRLLVELHQRAAQQSGFPQDIAWTVHQGEAWLLQLKPIGRLPERWRRESTAHRFPQPTTRLTWDIVGAGFDASLVWSLDWMGLPPLAGRWLARLDGYVYANAMAESVFESAIAVEFTDLAELRSRLPEIRRRYAWVHALPPLWMRDADRYLLQLGRLSRGPATAPDVDRLWHRIQAIRELGADWFRPRLALALADGCIDRLLGDLAAAVAGPQLGPALHDDLVCAVETRSQQVEAELHALFELAQADPRLCDLLAGTDGRGALASGRLGEFPEFESRLERFLDDHGHRERVFDLAHPTWSGEPWRLLDALKAMLARSKTGGRHLAPDRRLHLLRVRQGQAEARFLALLPEDLRFFASELLRLARLYAGLRDLERYHTTRLAPPLRDALLALGARIVEVGGLDSVEDIFHLPLAALDAWRRAAIDAPTLAALARQGRADHADQGRRAAPAAWPPAERFQAAGAGADVEPAGPRPARPGRRHPAQRLDGLTWLTEC